MPYLACVQTKKDETVESSYAKKMARKAKANGRNFDPFRGGGGAGDDDDDDADGDAGFDGGAGASSGGSGGFIPAKLSKRILAEAREQQLDDEADPEMRGGRSKHGSKRVHFGMGAGSKAGRGGRRDEDDDEDDDEYDDDDEERDVIDFEGGDGVALEGEYVGLAPGDEEVSAEDAAVLARFMPGDGAARKTLADIIMEKLAEKSAWAAASSGGGGPGGEAGMAGPYAGMGLPTRVPGEGLDPKVIQVYTEVGKFLAHYKSGRLPKVLKVAPALAQWEDVTFLTNPETWTPHATYAVTKIFASNFNVAKAQRFYNAVLLPKCRDDIFLHKRLNFHLYLALKKATYKPAAFYKGIILPLAQGGDCTLREAVIFGSVLAKASIPQLHSAAAIMKLASLEYTGAVSVFLRILTNKKYTLPYIVVDAVVEHFLPFLDVDGPLPVIWHRSVLALAQRYKADLTPQQKEQVRALVTKHNHHAITPEIRRELASAGCRGDPVSMAAPDAGAAGAGSSSSSAPTSGSGGGGGGGGGGYFASRRGAGKSGGAAAAAAPVGKASRQRSGDELDVDDS
jgi:essential nuclear protein 1